MSPANFYYGEQARGVINGPRPSPLRINKVSNVIQKPLADQKQHRKPPVIIYTHSPKVIHTQARDFMALVQKLTGFSSSRDENFAPVENKMKKNFQNLDLVGKSIISHEEKESSSVVTDEIYEGGGDAREACSAVSPLFGTRDSYLADIPLFTPTDYSCSPGRLFRFSDMISPLPNMGNILMASPTFLELPEY